ncbi:MAG: isoamylase early set domain-containing protein [Candidatus Bipolaricaulia bacterium]
MNEERFESYLREGLNQEIESHLQRLEGLEERVIGALEERALRRGRWAKVLEPLLVLMQRRPAVALATTAAAFLIIGLFLGMGLGLGGPSLGGGGEGVWFVVAYPEAQSVTIAGDFNGWTDTPLKRGKDGIWTIKLDLKPGRYEYAFKIDGKKWVPDPRADEYVKTYGNQYNSVIYV